MTRFWVLLRVLFLISIVYIIYLIRNQFLFEKFLDTLDITFDDFPAEYTGALISSTALKKPLEFDYSTLPTFNSSTTSHIPPIIHFVWFKDLYETHKDITEIPSIGSDAPTLCRDHNPNYTINIWNATAARDLIENHYSWFLPTYDGYRHPIQRVDAFKYFVLWHYGGVYMDLDIACRRPLDTLLQFPAWFPRASPMGVNNDLMASRAQHPVIEKMTNTLIARDKNLLFPYLTIFWTTGPQFTSDVLKMWFNEGLGRRYVLGSSKKTSDPDQYFILPQKFYSEEYTFFGHSPGGTWHGTDVAVVLWLVDRPWVVMLAISTIVLACVFFFVRRSKFKRRVYKQLKLAEV